MTDEADEIIARAQANPGDTFGAHEVLAVVDALAAARARIAELERGLEPIVNAMLMGWEGSRDQELGLAPNACPLPGVSVKDALDLRALLQKEPSPND